MAWGDYDNDGDLDILLTGAGVAKVYRNDGPPPNTPPNPPSSLAAVRNGGNVTFSWTGATDDHTPVTGLCYNLRVGTSLSGDLKVPGMALPTGFRKVPRLGNAQERTSWTIALPPGPYDWSVQAIDASFLGSAFAAATVSVEDSPWAPSSFELGPAMPNPFTTGVSLSYNLPQASRVRLAIFDTQGRCVRVLVSGLKEAGRQLVRWDGRDGFGRQQRNGVYLARLTAGGNAWTRKLILAR